MASSSSSSSSSNQVLQPSEQVLLTREQLEAMDYNTLVKMDAMYSFTTSRKTAKTKKTKDAIITRLLKNRVKKGKFAPEQAAYLHYELTHPIAKALPVYQLTKEEIEKGLMVQPTDGTFIPPYLVGEIYTIAKTMEDRDDELRFIKSKFEPNILHSNTRVFHVTINGFTARMNFGTALQGIHYRNVFSPTFFIKDYSYLAKKFEIDSTQLKSRDQYRDEAGWLRGDYGPQPAFTHTIPNRAIYNNYADFKNNQISKFFIEHLFPTYTLYYVIDNILTILESHRKASKVNIITQGYINTTSLDQRYLPQAQNNPINILKVYIRELNNRLTNLKEYKIIINNEKVKELNARLDAINKLLVNPDPSIPNQLNAKFEERVISIVMKPANKRFEKRGSVKTTKATNKSMFNKYSAKEDGLKKTIKRHHSARRHTRSKNSSRRIKSV